MRLEKRIILRADIGRVWNALSAPECWLALNEAFAGWRGRLRLGPSGAKLASGGEVVLADSRGRPIVRWRVVQCVPNERLELVATGTLRISYHLTASFALDSTSPQTTVVHFTFTAILLNPIVEVLSFILPANLLYGGRMRRLLEKLRSLVE